MQYDRVDELVLDMLKYNADKDFDEKTNTLRSVENPDLEDFEPTGKFYPNEQNNKSELWKYRGERHEVLVDPDEVEQREFDGIIRNFEEELFEKRETALIEGNNSFVFENQTHLISEADRTEFEQRSKLGAKFDALEAKEDSFTWRGVKHVFTAEEKAQYAEIEEEERMEAKAQALYAGESTYEFNGETHEFDPAELQEARELLQVKAAALEAGEDSFTFKGQTVEFSEEEVTQYHEEGEYYARTIALIQGEDSYTYEDETHVFSAEEKAEFAEDKQWADQKVAKSEAAFLLELAEKVKSGELTAQEAETEKTQMVESRQEHFFDMLAELEERKEQYLDKKWLDEYAETD